MPFKLGVLAVHGMGDQRADFADPMIRELSARLAKLGGDPAAICWEPVFWADVLEGRETALLRELSAAGTLDHGDLRHFIIHSLGDAIAYQQVPQARQQVNVYQEIHRRVAECDLVAFITHPAVIQRILTHRRRTGTAPRPRPRAAPSA